MSRTEIVNKLEALAAVEFPNYVGHNFASLAKHPAASVEYKALVAQYREMEMAELMDGESIEELEASTNRCETALKNRGY